ncbi:CPBP family intramembrane metalloprotease [Kineosporiaceae bacterium B12]|nr:CPBP family intramembrane metalloprotease [Kineococcus rubinsiae]
MLVLFTAVSAVVGAVVTSSAAGKAAGGLLLGLGCAGGAAALYAGAVRVLERRDAAEVSLHHMPSQLGRGLVVGLGLFTLTLAVIAAAGGYRVTGWGSAGDAVASVGVMAAVAVTEEVLFRAVLFRVAEELTGTWGALAVSSAVFGAAHLANPGGTLWGALAVMVEAGLLLGAAYTLTRSLWLPIGLHWGWNLAEGGIFGASVSGSGHGPAGLLTGHSTGPAVLTGGAFGPEASVVAVLVCSAATFALLLVAVRRGRLRSRTRRSLRGGPSMARAQGTMGA